MMKDWVKLEAGRSRKSLVRKEKFPTSTWSQGELWSINCTPEFVLMQMSWASIFQCQSVRLTSSFIKWESYLHYWAIWILNPICVKHLARCPVQGKCDMLWVISNSDCHYYWTNWASSSSVKQLARTALKKDMCLVLSLQTPWGVTEISRMIILWVIWYPRAFFWMVLILKSIRIKVKSQKWKWFCHVLISVMKIWI